MQNFSSYPLHIYIHWPFCKNKCEYCDFVSFQDHEDYIEEYHLALLKQIKLFCRSIKKLNSVNKKIKTVFLGGGSPSLYPTNLLEELIKSLQDNFDLSELEEFTIEVNPADVDESKLDCWSDLGINRLSIGVQYLNDQVLFNLNRKQTTKDFCNIMNLAPKYFSNISVDLILGLPGTSERGWFNTLREVTKFPINHLSVYLLMVYDKTPLCFKLKSKIIKSFSEEFFIKAYKKTIEFLFEKEFIQYEISNFAKSGFESKHNLAYWNRRPYVGYGLSAASFDGKKRYVNEKKLWKYLQCFNASENTCCTKDILTKRDHFLEELMLGLRLLGGMDLHSMLYFLSGTQKEAFITSLEYLKNQGFLCFKGGKVVLTVKGMLLENEVVLWLLKSLDKSS